MSDQTMSLPAPAGTAGSASGPAGGSAARSAGGLGAGSAPDSSSTPATSVGAAMPRRTPTRPVVSIALLLFVPALMLVLDGNLSVQMALMRFAGALVVSWVAARLVFATVQAYARPGSARDRAAEASTPRASAQGAPSPGGLGRVSR